MYEPFFLLHCLVCCQFAEAETWAKDIEERIKHLCEYMEKLGGVNDALAIQQLEFSDYDPYEP